MLVEIREIESRRKDYPKRIMVMQCSVCNRLFERNYGKRFLKITFHICSCECQAKAQRLGGSLDQQKRQVFLERYGVESPLQNKEIRQKLEQTNVQRYGAKNVLGSPIILERVRQHNLEKFGVEWHTQSQNFKDKAAQTWMRHYGVDHPMKSDEIKAKYDFKKQWIKAHETKKKNGTYAASRVEQKFYETLCDVFGASDIERQRCIKSDDEAWYIDFYVASINLHIQFDGAYWHGLDRPLNVIHLLTNCRDVAILRAYERDRRQDRWFFEKGLKLVRVVDVNFKQRGKLMIEELVKVHI